MAGSTPYRPPAKGIEYNEFVGELRPAENRAFTEVHVRYGKRNNVYFDWSITLSARHGDVEEFRQSKNPLERRTLEIVDISESAVRRHVFDPYEPDKPPETTVLVRLQAGDGIVVDQQYQHQMNGLFKSWTQKHGPAADDPHTHTTFNFVSTKQHPDFQPGATFDWVRNTLVCLSTDLADAVISERAGYYFPTSPSTAGVMMPDGVMKFINMQPGGKLAPDVAAAHVADTSEDGPMKATGDVTMGMLVDSIYGTGWTEGVEDLLKD